MVFRELTMDDMKDKLNMKGSLFDILAAVASRAKEIYEIEQSARIPDFPQPKSSRNPTAAVVRISDDDDSGSGRGRKYNSPTRRYKQQQQDHPAPPLPGEAKKVRAKIPDSSPPKRNRKRNAAAARISDDDDYSGSAPSKKRKYDSPRGRYNQQQQDQPAPPLPEEMKKAIEKMATEPPKLVIQKELSVTDMSIPHGRLSMPINQIRDQGFLTEEEKEFIQGYIDGKNKKYKPVRIFEPSLTTVIAKLCQWDMKKKNGGKTSSNYVINGVWNDIVRRNKLRAGMVLQVWGFRVEGDLGLALVRLPTNKTRPL